MHNIIALLLSLIASLPFIPKPTALHQQEVTKVINSPSPFITPTPTEVPFISNTITYQSEAPTPSEEPTIDCTGPDGKHLQITQNQCDAFNKAWQPTPLVRNNMEITPAQAGQSINQQENEMQLYQAMQEEAQLKANWNAYLQCESNATKYAGAYPPNNPEMVDLQYKNCELMRPR